MRESAAGPPEFHPRSSHMMGLLAPLVSWWFYFFECNSVLVRSRPLAASTLNPTAHRPQPTAKLYSYRSASMGSSLLALAAGYIPKINPMPAGTMKADTTAQSGMLPIWPNMSLPRSAPRA